MTWQSAITDAERMLAVMQERIAAISAKLKTAPPKLVRVAVYPTPHDYRYFRRDDPWSWEYHTEVCRAIVRLAAREKLKVELTDCDAAGCAAWCDSRGLVPSNKWRAAYVATLTG